MKLICFAAQLAAVEALLTPFLSSIGELVEAKPDADIHWGKALRDVAKPGDVLVVVTNHKTPAPPEVYAAARDIGMACWSLSDHWVKKVDDEALAAEAESSDQA